MRKNMQLVCDEGKGDCFRACVTSLLGIPNDPELPNVDDSEWFSKWHKFLGPMGLEINYEGTACWRNGYWIASVKSKNFATCTHAIVMYQHEVFHDPSTRARYEAGTSLLGGDTVLGGWILEVADASKLAALVTMQCASVGDVTGGDTEALSVVVQ